MTATLMYKADTEQPKTTDVTFILSEHRLITVRYDEADAVHAGDQQAVPHVWPHGLR